MRLARALVAAAGQTPTLDLDFDLSHPAFNGTTMWANGPIRHRLVHTFFFRTPSNAQSDTTAIRLGTAILSNLVRGFKVHVSALAPPMVASTMDIEIARFDATITGSLPLISRARVIS